MNNLNFLSFDDFVVLMTDFGETGTVALDDGVFSKEYPINQYSSFHLVFETLHPNTSPFFFRNLSIGSSPLTQTMRVVYTLPSQFTAVSAPAQLSGFDGGFISRVLKKLSDVLHGYTFELKIEDNNGKMFFVVVYDADGDVVSVYHWFEFFVNILLPSLKGQRLKSRSNVFASFAYMNKELFEDFLNSQVSEGQTFSTSFISCYPFPKTTGLVRDPEQIHGQTSIDFPNGSKAVTDD